MNRLIRHILVFVSVLIIFSACDLVEMEPIGAKVESNYIKDINSASQAFNGALQPLLGMYSSGLTSTLSIISDESFAPAARDGASENLDKLNLNSNSATGFWGSCYTGITRVNTALAQLEKLKVSDSQQSKKDAIIGQMHFLRGYYYFLLVRLYGEVPIQPKINTPDDSKQPRSSFEDLYTYIEDDFKKAVDMLPSKMDGSVGLEYGKPSKMAVYSAMADFYLTFERWDQVVSAADNVINSGLQDTVAYPEIFHNEDPTRGEDYSQVYNKAIIWDANYNENNGQNFTWFFTPTGIGDHTQGTGFLLGTHYATNDTLATSETGAPSGAANGDSALMQTFEDGDKRQNLIMQDQLAFEGKAYYGTIKFNATVNYGFNSGRLNYPIYRYIDVLLMKSEALNELGQNIQEAERIVNDIVRKHAGLDPLPQSTTSDQQLFREAIWQERFVEFAFEGKRYFDLNRTGRVKEQLVDKQNFITNDGVSSHLITNPITNKEWLVFPIPQSELNANPNINENNPGY